MEQFCKVLFLGNSFTRSASRGYDLPAMVQQPPAPNAVKAAEWAKEAKMLSRGKFLKKLMQKIADFLIGLGSEKSEKTDPKTTPKWSPRWSEIEPRRKLKRKMGKV